MTKEKIENLTLQLNECVKLLENVKVSMNLNDINTNEFYGIENEISNIKRHLLDNEDSVLFQNENVEIDFTDKKDILLTVSGMYNFAMAHDCMVGILSSEFKEMIHNNFDSETCKVFGNPKMTTKRRLWKKLADFFRSLNVFDVTENAAIEIADFIEEKIKG